MTSIRQTFQAESRQSNSLPEVISDEQAEDKTGRLNYLNVEARRGFEPLHKGFADLSLSHLGTSPYPAAGQPPAEA